MNPEKTSSQIAVSMEKEDSSKLVSLLALATSAIAIPQTSHADIFYSDHTLSPITVGITASASYSITNLPGIARIGVQFLQSSTIGGSSSVRFVLIGQTAGYVRMKTSVGFAVPALAGMLWNDITGGIIKALPSAGAAGSDNHFPDSFTDRYYAFRFEDSTQGNALRYGWIHVDLANNNLNISAGPHLTIYGWAYESGAAQIPMGMVPEPSSTAILALGALTLGSKGLRSWRRNRVKADKL